MTDLTELEYDILHYLLIDGANGPSSISENIGGHKNSVSRALRDLEDESLVENKGGGVWTLTVDGIRLIRALERE